MPDGYARRFDKYCGFSGFEDLQDRLGLVLSTKVHSEDEDGHNHRKRRSIDTRILLEQPTWVSVCLANSSDTGL